MIKSSLRSPRAVGYETRCVSSAEAELTATTQSDRIPRVVSLPLASDRHGDASDDSARLRAIATAADRCAASAIRRTVTAADPASARAPVASITIATITSINVNPARDSLHMCGRYMVHLLKQHHHASNVIESLRAGKQEQHTPVARGSSFTALGTGVCRSPCVTGPSTRRVSHKKRFIREFREFRNSVRERTRPILSIPEPRKQTSHAGSRSVTAGAFQPRATPIVRSGMSLDANRKVSVVCS